MKTFLLTTCVFGALMMASGAPSLAGGLSRAGATTLRLADACETNCRTNADACRTQCSDPEEQAQCIVACDKSACKANCNKFEDACKQRCPNPRG
jgi:hypothetical protein